MLRRRGWGLRRFGFSTDETPTQAQQKNMFAGSDTLPSKLSVGKGTYVISFKTWYLM